MTNDQTAMLARYGIDYAEAMERFNLTRDQLYHYVKYHNIPRIKVGKYTKILRAELDKFFEPPKIE